jgi:hypothetical protein
MKIQFEGHQGTLEIETNKVTFYNLTFNSIVDAAKFLRPIKVGPNYQGWFYRMHIGLLNPEDGRVYVDERWLPDENFAEEYIREKCNLGMRSKKSKKNLEKYMPL